MALRQVGPRGALMRRVRGLEGEDRLRLHTVRGNRAALPRESRFGAVDSREVR